MKHLPSIEALTAADDTRLRVELEICEALDRLARVRALVDRADQLLANVLARGQQANDADARDFDAEASGTLASAILASLRRV
ncbi:MAG: hypothetical protein KF764_06985 [Labilithrix sp.]|nr:hypothetical protein [Labilithrix sp.]MBX3219360.1 hypothetical protein [Labilithrix sp.]